MKKLLLIVCVIILLVSCFENNGGGSVVVDVGIHIKYLNNSGDNLFEIDNGYNEADILIYHKIDGEWKEYHKSNLDSPKGIRIENRDDGKYLVLFPNIICPENNIAETKIKFSDSDIDIVKVEIKKQESSTTITKVWYNNVFKKARTFKVIK